MANPLEVCFNNLSYPLACERLGLQTNCKVYTWHSSDIFAAPGLAPKRPMTLLMDMSGGGDGIFMREHNQEM